MIATDADRSQGFRVLVADRGLQLTGRLDERWVGILVGALSADPHTWDELSHALTRFAQDYELPLDLGLRRCEASVDAPADGVDVEELDCLIDLPGRLLVTLWDQAADPIPARVFDGDPENGRTIEYSLSSEWELTSDFGAWSQAVAVRRAERRQRSSRDFRTTLYGLTLLEFIAKRAANWHGTLKGIDTVPGGSPNGTAWREACSAAVRAIYQQWLDHRPIGLDGRTVREVLQEDQDHLAFDMSSRELQWSYFRKPPCELRDTDTAYRTARVGPQESVLYDELFDALVSAYLAREDSRCDERDKLADELDWLRQRRDEWLRTPGKEHLMGKSPCEVIDQERRRRPFVVDSADHLLDMDCPLCHMMASPEFAPVFWRLDHCVNGLSAMRTGCADEGDLRFGIECDRVSDLNGADRTTDSWQDAMESSVWKRVGIFPSSRQQPAVVELFTIAACAAELIEDLKERSADRELIDALIRHVGNLSASLQHRGHELVGPVVSRFCECLDEVEQAHADLTEKIDDLQPRLLALVAE
jgi:hypothetical protein